MGLGKKMGMLLVVVAVLLALGLSAGTALACDSNIIGDFVWNDLNANGIQDAGEPGIALVTVELHKCCDDSLVGSTTTDANGKYLFTDVYHGSYYIKFILPTGYTFSLQDQGTDNKVDSDANAAGVTACTYLYDSDDRTWDAGMYQLASVGDFVWEDLNANGIQDAEEPGVGNVTVELHKWSDDSTVGSPTTTDANGKYLFTGVTPGDYYIKFVLPSGYAFSLPNQGGDAAKDSDADSTGKTVKITLVSGGNDLTWDAGMYQQPASVGDFVWNDANKNGIQDDGGNGISGVTVNLYKWNETNLVATTTTDASGYYGFSNLVPGSYYLEFKTELNYDFSPQDQGADDVDSDADPNTGKTGEIILVPGENNPNLDVGLYVEEPHNPPVVPAISTWGIAGMAAAMAVVGGFMLRRRATDSTR